MSGQPRAWLLRQQIGIDSICPELQTAARLLHPEDAPPVRSIVSQALAEGKEQTVECSIIRPNGEVIRILARGQIDLNKDGEPLRLIRIVQNITERKRAEQMARVEATNKARCGPNVIVPSTTNLRPYSP